MDTTRATVETTPCAHDREVVSVVTLHHMKGRECYRGDCLNLGKGQLLSIQSHDLKEQSMVAPSMKEYIFHCVRRRYITCTLHGKCY